MPTVKSHATRNKMGRREAGRQGLVIIRVRSTRWNADREGGFLLVDIATQAILLGVTADQQLVTVSLGEIEAYLNAVRTGDEDDEAELAA